MRRSTVQQNEALLRVLETNQGREGLSTASSGMRRQNARFGEEKLCGLNSCLDMDPILHGNKQSGLVLAHVSSGGTRGKVSNLGLSV